MTLIVGLVCAVVFGVGGYVVGLLDCGGAALRGFDKHREEDA